MLALVLVSFGLITFPLKRCTVGTVVGTLVLPWSVGEVVVEFSVGNVGTVEFSVGNVGLVVGSGSKRTK